MEQVIKILVGQLANKGMQETVIISCIGIMWNMIIDERVADCEDLNSRMQRFGWEDFELDLQTFKIALQVFK